MSQVVDSSPEDSVEAVQFGPGGLVRITFSSEQRKAGLEEAGFVSFGPVRCNVVRTLPTFALVYGFPFEGSNDAVREVLSRYGEVRAVEHQSWGFRPVCSGTRKVRIVRKGHIPRFVIIDGIRCKVWYREQPVTCDICSGEHIASVCPLRGKCTRCHQEGHVRRDCSLPAWQPPPPVVGSASADPTPAESLASTDVGDNELSSPSSLDPLLDSSSTEVAPDVPPVEGVIPCVNESEDLPMHDDSGPSAGVLTPDGSLPLPQSGTTEVLEEVSCGGSQGGGEGVSDASPPSPDASQSILATHVAAPTKVTSSESAGVRKRPPDDSLDSDCSADDVLSDDPSLVSMPSVSSGPKKPAAKKAARPTVVACHSLPAVVSRIPVGKRPLKKTG